MTFNNSTFLAFRLEEFTTTYVPVPDFLNIYIAFRSFDHGTLNPSIFFNYTTCDKNEIYKKKIINFKAKNQVHKKII